MRHNRLFLFALLGLIGCLIASPITQPQDSTPGTALEDRPNPFIKGALDGLQSLGAGLVGLAIIAAVNGTPPGWGLTLFALGMSAGTTLTSIFEELDEQRDAQSGHRRRALASPQEQARERALKVWNEEGEAGIQRRITRGANILKELSKPGGVLSAQEKPQWYIDIVDSARQAATLVKHEGPYLNVKADITGLPHDLVAWTEARFEIA